ncbi:MAG: alpha-amylase family glycosyl hydrolase [Candidatus Heimdallarchaeota archaeon]
MSNHHQLYEINTRVWLNELNEKLKKQLTLLKVPDEVWTNLIDMGFEWIWLMGVWESSSVDEKLKIEIKQEMDEALPGWQAEDAFWSPYSIVQYKLNPILGKSNDLKKIHKKLNEMGAKLMLDFVPNHFGKASPFVSTHPEYFIHTKTAPTRNPHLFDYVSMNYWVAYGKDPYFPPWEDTFQLNYYNPETRMFMIQTLLKIANICDGVRCDMAMLCLNDIFKKTWDWYLNDQEMVQPQSEFCKEAIEEVKSYIPNFTFLAEVYWDLEWRIQQLGFDYTYDKQLYDRLLKLTSPSSLKGVRGHLLADLDFQTKSLRFIENHDEPRAIAAFGRDRSLAAAVIAGTVPGLILYHHGQLEGKLVRQPLRLRRTKPEPCNEGVSQVYERLLDFTDQEVLQKGVWSLLEVKSAWEANDSWKNILAWQWTLPEKNKLSLVVVNYSPICSQGRVLIDINVDLNMSNVLLFEDKMDNKTYEWEKGQILKQGIFMDLQPYQVHLFNVKVFES